MIPSLFKQTTKKQHGKERYEFRNTRQKQNKKVVLELSTVTIYGSVVEHVWSLAVFARPVSEDTPKGDHG